MRGYTLPGVAHCAVAAVIEQVAWEFDTPVAGILSDRRARHLVWARYAIAWLARRVTAETLTAIGAAMGGRPADAVANLVRGATRLRDAEERFRAQVDFVESLLVSA